MKRYIHADNDKFSDVYDVTYEGNWMQLILRPTDDGYKVIRSVSNMDDDDIRLYAETDTEPEIDDNGYENDDDMYNELKEDIIEQAKEYGIPETKLHFWYD